MMRKNLFFCQNQINYEIASRIATPRDVLILEKGIVVTPRSAGRHLPATGFIRSIAKRLIRSSFFETVYLPHHKTINMDLFDGSATSVHYLDDGLDTVRQRPKNFTRQIKNGQKFFTFLDYTVSPGWYDPSMVVRIGRLKSLALKKPPRTIPIPEEEFIVIESANLDIEAIQSLTNSRSVCYLEHRIKDKRLSGVPEHWRRAQFGAYTESIIYEGYSGCVISADTMATVVLHHLQPYCKYQLIYTGIEISYITPWIRSENRSTDDHQINIDRSGPQLG
jgi:hypothetical protein